VVAFFATQWRGADGRGYGNGAFPDLACAVVAGNGGAVSSRCSRGRVERGLEVLAGGIEVLADFEDDLRCHYLEPRG
jgi:hypothetical protein